MVVTNEGVVLLAISEKLAMVWNLNTGQLLTTLTGHSNSVNSFAITPDGQTLVSGSQDRTIKVWRLPK
jgi:WD40 repeat protein